MPYTVCNTLCGNSIGYQCQSSNLICTKALLSIRMFRPVIGSQVEFSTTAFFSTEQVFNLNVLPVMQSIK